VLDGRDTTEGVIVNVGGSRFPRRHTVQAQTLLIYLVALDERDRMTGHAEPLGSAAAPTCGFDGGPNATTFEPAGQLSLASAPTTPTEGIGA
jgi:hypothetical protein